MVTVTDPTKQGGQLNSWLKHTQKKKRSIPRACHVITGDEAVIKHVGAVCGGWWPDTDTVLSVSKCPCSRVKESVHVRRMTQTHEKPPSSCLLPGRVGGLSEPFATGPLQGQNRVLLTRHPRTAVPDRKLPSHVPAESHITFSTLYLNTVQTVDPN